MDQTTILIVEFVKQINELMFLHWMRIVSKVLLVMIIVSLKMC